jgi:hypothetical protein
MKRVLAFLALGVSLLAVSPLWSQDFLQGVDHLEFIRTLRDKHPDLALEYIERLNRMPNVPKDLKDALSLEQGRTQLAVAAKDPDPARRAKAYDDAATKMEAYLKANANSPDAPIANLDLARIYAFKAKATFDKAKMAEGKQTRKDGMLKARAGFDQAYKMLDKAYEGINTQMLKKRTEKLREAQADAEFEMASALMNQLLTYDAEAESQDRATVGVKAIKEIERVAKKGERVGSMALAMLIKCYDELDDTSKADETIRTLERDGIEPGKRIGKANYVTMYARKDLNNKKVIPLCQEWIKAYPTSLETPEGIAVRYQLAQAARVQAAQLKGPEADALYNIAERYYDQVEHTESEFTDRARTHKMQILIARKPELTKGDISKLTTFKELYLRAQLESGQLEEETRKGKADPQHMPNIIKALTLALEKMDDAVSQQELIDARFMLTYYLLLSGDHYRAIVLGEDLARSYPNSNRAGQAGAYILGAYAHLIEEGEKVDPSSNAVATDRARMKSLAEYIEANWKTDVAADEARFQMAIMALRQKNYPDAVTLLDKISPSYLAYPLVLFNLGNAAQLVAQGELKAGDEKDKVAPPKPYKTWNEIAVSAYEKLPTPKNMDPDTNRLFFMAKVRLAFLYLSEKKIAAMDKVSTDLMLRYKKLPNALQKEVEPMVSPLEVYAIYGKADIAFKSSEATKYAQVTKILQPMVKQIADKKLPPGIEPQLPKVVLFLYLKACLLDGKIDDARAALDMLQTGGGFENQGQVLAGLVKDLSDHIKELAKDPKKKEEHDKAVANFSKFLDVLAQQNLQNIKPELLRFLAQSYSALDRHDQAAALLANVQEPKAGAKPEEYKVYRFTRLMLAHEYRLAKKFTEADKILKELEKTDFAASSLEFREEQNYLLEDVEKFGLAAKGWNHMYEDLKKGAQKNARLQEPAQKALYRYIFCVYSFAKKQTDEKKKATYMNRAGNLILQLELGDANMGGLKEQYTELMNKEPPLKEAFETRKKAHAEGKVDKPEEVAKADAATDPKKADPKKAAREDNSNTYLMLGGAGAFLSMVLIAGLVIRSHRRAEVNARTRYARPKG